MWVEDGHTSPTDYSIKGMNGVENDIRRDMRDTLDRLRSKIIGTCATPEESEKENEDNED